MKIRNGFVSNSSSSSFVILGEKVNLSDIEVKDLKNKKYKYIADTGMSNEANIFIEISNKSILDVLQKAADGEYDYTEDGSRRRLINGNVEVYKSYFDSYDWSDKEIDSTTLPKKFRVFQFNCDQWSPEDAKELEQAYKGEY